MLGHVDDRYYGEPDAYQRVEAAVKGCEFDTVEFKFDSSSLSLTVLNELAMEVAYHLAQTAAIRPIFPEKKGESTEHLIKPLVPISDDLFHAGEVPPLHLPKEIVSEELWRQEFVWIEENIWKEFLVYVIVFHLPEQVLSQACEFVAAYLYQAHTTQKPYWGMPINQTTLDKVKEVFADIPNSVCDFDTFRDRVNVCITKLIMHDKSLLELQRLFGHALVLFLGSLSHDVDLDKRIDEEHEKWADGFFHKADKVVQRFEADLSLDLKMRSVRWEVIVPLRIKFHSPLTCPEAEFTIKPSSDFGEVCVADGPACAHFESVSAHHYKEAVLTAKNRVRIFLNALTLHFNKGFDSGELSVAYYKSEYQSDWEKHWEGRSYPENLLNNEKMRECGQWILPIIKMQGSNDLARRVIEGLRLFHLGKSSIDVQQRFTNFWLAIDIFIQNTNSPEKDLPLYQLMYVHKDSPPKGSQDYVSYQKKRHIQFEREAKSLWKIRNNGSVHHGKQPRWEERSLKLWGQTLEGIAGLVLRYSVDECHATPPKTSPIECLEAIRQDLRKDGVI